MSMNSKDSQRLRRAVGPNVGTLLLIGGREDKEGEMEILRRFAEAAGGSKARIEVITTASSEPEIVGSKYEDAFGRIGVKNVKWMHIESRSEAADAKILSRIKKATAIFFSGGNQLRLTSILDATPVTEAVREHYFDNGGLVAGTSAGAAALTGTIIYQGESSEALLKGSVKMTGGFGFLRNTVVDTHFVARGRIGRLLQVVTGNPRLIGLGLGEDAGVFITEGTRLEAVGSGLVIVVDGRDIGYSNMTEIEIMEPFSVENIKIHVLSRGAGFDLSELTFIPPTSQEEEGDQGKTPLRKASDGDAKGTKRDKSK